MAYKLRNKIMAEITPNYVNEFNCLGSDCIDTCCQGWNINIDKNTHDKYQKLELEGISNVNDFLNVWDKPTKKAYSAIKMKKNGYCPFLSKDKLCGIQKKYGENYLSQTCNRFPRREIDFITNKFVTLKLACPEAARLCLSSKNSMNIVEDKLYNKKSISVVTKEYKNGMTQSGELILNKFYKLLKNKDVNYINSLVIVHKLLDEQKFISLDLNKFEEIYNFYYQEFYKTEIVAFDNSYIKLSLLEDLIPFLEKEKKILEKYSIQTGKFFELMTSAYEELIERFDNPDNAAENFNLINDRYVSKFENKNKHILRNFLLNEILGYSQIFTCPTPPCRNKIYITLLETAIIKLLITARCSKEQRMPTLDDYIDIVYNVDKSNGIFIDVFPGNEFYIKKPVKEIIEKIDSNSIFNSVIFLCS